MIDEVKTLTVADAVAEKILNRLAEGELRWGQQLPAQRELAKILNIGVSSLREGLQILQAMGFVELKRGQGTYITKNPSTPLSKNIAMSIYTDTSVQNLMEAREIFDTGLAVLSSKKAQDCDIKRMEEHVELMRKSIREKDPFATKFDIEFHKTLVESVKNPLLEKFSYILRSSLEKFIGDIVHTEKGVNLHRNVLEAIKMRDAMAARDSMLELLKHTRKMYLEHLYKKENMNGISSD